jgi:hypothetical protein
VIQAETSKGGKRIQKRKQDTISEKNKEQFFAEIFQLHSYIIKPHYLYATHEDYAFIASSINLWLHLYQRTERRSFIFVVAGIQFEAHL